MESRELFLCDEESRFYQECIERLVFPSINTSEEIAEFGTGDGLPVIHALQSLPQERQIKIHGYEINKKAYELLCTNIKIVDEQRYIPHFGSFFEGVFDDISMIISNPPYLPYSSSDILLPTLWGGIYGDTISRKLLEQNAAKIMLLISAYSNPIGQVEYALLLGYKIVDFHLTILPFGTYSSEPKVFEYIKEMAREQKAFIGEKEYKIAGVLFSKETATSCRKEELLARLCKG